MTVKLTTITEAEYHEHCNSDDGLCLACGEFSYGFVEPDAENYKCEDCGAMKVCGTEQALLLGHLDIS